MSEIGKRWQRIEREPWVIAHRGGVGFIFMGCRGMFHAVQTEGLREFRSVIEARRWLEDSGAEQESEEVPSEDWQEKLIKVIAGLQALHNANHRMASALEDMAIEMRSLRERLGYDDSKLIR